MTLDSDMNHARGILERIEHVADVKAVDEDQFQCAFNGTRDQVKNVLKLLIDNDVLVRWFSENEADLEDVFMNVISHK
jgi:pyruvate-formate lyase-activating enzyme